jgi:periplasmic protein TonB
MRSEGRRCANRETCVRALVGRYSPRPRQAIFIASRPGAAAWRRHFLGHFSRILAGHSAIPVVEHSAREEPGSRPLLPRLSLPHLRLPEGAPRRVGAIAAALAIELLILWALLSLGVGSGAGSPETASVTSFDVRETSEPDAAEQQAAPEAEPAPSAPAPDPATPQDPAPATPQPPSPLTIPPTALPRESPVFIPPAPPAPPPIEVQPEAPPAPPAPPRATAVIRPGAQYGPANTPRAGSPDSEVVGRAPDGSPLYAARWFREPSHQELAGYLSAARGPGWGLIACKTAPNWRVEECVIVGESPAGSQIARSAQAAAWQFQVRPPRVGGEYQVGAWVRIRITYALAPGG